MAASMSRIRQVSPWGLLRRTMPDPDGEIGKNLAAFTPEDMRVEIAIVHGIYLPAPFIAYAGDIYSARIADDEIKNFWWTVTGDVPPPTELYLNIVRNGEPGYSWYVDDKPGSTCYMERGGGCLFMETLADACETLTISVDKLTSPSKDDDDRVNAEDAFFNNLVFVRTRLWLAYGLDTKHDAICSRKFGHKDAAEYKTFVFDMLPTLTALAGALDPLAIRVRESIHQRLSGGSANAVLPWIMANGKMADDEAMELSVFRDAWGRMK